MSSSLRTLAVRIPTRTATAAPVLPRRTFTTSAPSPLAGCLARKPSTLSLAPSQQRCQLLTSTSTSTSTTTRFTRSASDLSKAARQAPNATKYNTATKLAQNPSGSGASAAEVSKTAGPLNWDTFFKLRVKRRRIQLLFSVLTGGALAGVGIAGLTAGLAETIAAQVPFDPFITLGLVVVACGGLGWVVGPSVGGQVFYLLNRSLKPQIRQKEGEFLKRVRKNRSDPSNSSAGNPGNVSLVAFKDVCYFC